ncbi:hypothetical protein, partial [Staphylococcus aureus]|uniref:hypothetical protein n=1 Tax=Staphylococcus aureus TaxID=1280 RepID=UPI00301D0848
MKKIIKVLAMSIFNKKNNRQGAQLNYKAPTKAEKATKSGVKAANSVKPMNTFVSWRYWSVIGVILVSMASLVATAV